jgi:hypothetical protein
MIVILALSLLATLVCSTPIDIGVWTDGRISSGTAMSFTGLTQSLYNNIGVSLSFTYRGTYGVNPSSCRSILPGFQSYAAGHSPSQYNILVVGFNTAQYDGSASNGVIGLSSINCGCAKCGGVFQGIDRTNSVIQSTMAHEISHAMGVGYHTSGCNLMSATVCGSTTMTQQVIDSIHAYVNGNCNGLGSGGGGCVSASMLVETPGGIVPVSDLKVGDMVRVPAPAPSAEGDLCAHDFGTYEPVEFFMHDSPSTLSCVRVCEDAENKQRCAVVSPTHFVKRDGKFVQASTLADAVPEACEGYASFYVNGGSFLTHDGAEVSCFASTSSFEMSHEAMHPFYSVARYLPISDYSFIGNHLDL